MSQITEFENLLPLLNKETLSNFDIILSNQMALDIFNFVKSKSISQVQMCK